MQNSTSAKFEKSPNIHLVRPIIHLVRIFALSTKGQLISKRLLEKILKYSLSANLFN